MTVNLGTLDWNAVVAISTIAIAVIGFLINRKLNKGQEQAERYALLVQFRREMIDYASEFFSASADAIALADLAETHGVDQEKCNIVSAELSALIDKGRFLFPNYKDGAGFGKEKGPAFEGFRREPLDAILAAFFAVESIRRPDQKQSYMRKSLREIIRANQPISREFRAENARSLIIEARRSFLNSVVPKTYPELWLQQFSDLLGPMDPLTDSEIDEREAHQTNAN